MRYSGRFAAHLKKLMKHYFIPVLAAITFFSCDSQNNSNEDVQGADSVKVETSGKELTTNSGLKIDIIQAGDGEKPNMGDIITVHYTGKLATNGEVFDTSIDRGRPFRFSIGKGEVIAGWDEGIAQLSKGAKATLYIPSNLGYGANATGTIPPNSDLIFEVEIIDIAPAPKPIAFERYDHGALEPNTTTSGLTYYIVEEGNGTKIQSGSKVKVHYLGYLKEGGQKFDSSFDRGEPIEVTIGKGQVIPGWEEGLSLLEEGTKATMVIPSALAYGERGYPGIIPPNADLVFDVQIMEVN
ncbi:MAG: FKBP-type peptidyl-prolyl cis-trans isomerase [Salibacteraceae bacterium]